MAAIDSETWRMNIENAADEVRSHYGNETVESIFRSYEATSTPLIMKESSVISNS